MSVVLLVNFGSEVHPLTITKRPLSLGRSSKCNVKFADEQMSSRHCEIFLNEAGRITVKDLDSSNGTFINDIKIEAGHVFIGDELKVGNIVMRIDETMLSRSETEHLSNESSAPKKKQRFVNLKIKSKSPSKNKVLTDFTQIKMKKPEDLNASSKTYIIEKDDLPTDSSNAKSSKKKKKIINKDKTGFFKKLFKGISKK